MSATSLDISIRNIAVATDFGPWSEQAARHALIVARQFGAAVHFLHAVRRSEYALVPDLMVELDELSKRDSENFISRLAALKDLDGIDIHSWNLDGEIPDVLDPVISGEKIDLLVLATRGRTGISKFLFGSIAEEICRGALCPVLTVGPACRRPNKELNVSRVLFATDLSKNAYAAIPYVLTAARTWNAEIDLLQFDSHERSDLLSSIEEFGRAFTDSLAGEPPPSIRYQGASGKLSAAVLDHARQNGDDLVVLGLDRDRSLYGVQSSSDAYEIICDADCPVLNVPPSSFRQPDSTSR